MLDARDVRKLLAQIAIGPFERKSLELLGTEVSKPVHRFHRKTGNETSKARVRERPVCGKGEVVKRV